jgi:hypothetical protein
MNVRPFCPLAALALSLFAGSGQLHAVAAGQNAGNPREARGAGGPDLTAALDSTLQAWPSREIKITVTVKNAGNSAAPKSVCQVFIRNAHPPRQTMRAIKKTVRPLAAGDQFQFAFSVKLGLGLYEIEAVADRAGRIAEADEKNNKTRITIAGK